MSEFERCDLESLALSTAAYRFEVSDENVSKSIFGDASPSFNVNSVTDMRLGTRPAAVLFMLMVRPIEESETAERELRMGFAASELAAGMPWKEPLREKERRFLREVMDIMSMFSGFSMTGESIRES